jgi:hypothetical protein
MKFYDLEFKPEVLENIAGRVEQYDDYSQEDLYNRACKMSDDWIEGLPCEHCKHTVCLVDIQKIKK